MIYKRIITKKLGQLLFERKIISKWQLDKALQLQKEEGGFLSQSLTKLGFVTEANIASCLSSQYGFPYLPLKNYIIDPKTVKIVPSAMARQFDLIPIDKIGTLLTVVMADPLNLNAIEELKLVTGCKVQPFIGTMSDVQEAITKYYGSSKESVEKIEVLPPQAPARVIDIGGKGAVDKRRFVRLDTKLSFHYAFQEEYKKGESKNISAIGILFSSDNIIPLWTFLVVRIKLPQSKTPIKAVGQVIRIDPLPNKNFDVAVHLTHVDPKDREKINEYVLEQSKKTPA